MEKINKSNFSGWLNIYKPKNISSAKLIAIIKKIFGKNKIGHAGTLDPLAEGILPVALGEATKLTSYLIDSTKKYEFTIKFGARTSSGDLDGEFIEECDANISKEELEKVLNKFIGKITQIPSKFSAIKINGIRAYKLARDGKEFEMPSREIEIYDIFLKNFDSENQTATIICSCSKGTYIRTLAEDIAFSLHNLGHVIELRRLSVGKFRAENSLRLQELEGQDLEGIKNYILPVDIALDDIPVINVGEEIAKKIRFGQNVSLDVEDCEILCIYSSGKLEAIGQIENSIFKVKRVFNL